MGLDYPDTPHSLTSRRMVALAGYNFLGGGLGFTGYLDPSAAQGIGVEGVEFHIEVIH